MPLASTRVNPCGIVDAVTSLLRPVPCCPPLAAAPLTEVEAAQLAGGLRALADPARLRLVSLILAGEGAQACVCDLVEPVGLTQPTVSHHLKVLVEAGLVVREKRGRWAYYRAVPEALEALADALHPRAGGDPPAPPRRTAAVG